MSWEGFLSDLVGLGGVSAPSSSYVRGVVITQAVRAGASANSILTSLSSAGLGLRRQQGLAMIREERSRQLAGRTAAQLDLNAPIDEALSGEPPANWTGQFVHQVAAIYRSRDEEGNYLLHTRTLGIKSPVPLTAAEATQAAAGILETTMAGAPEGYVVQASDVLSYGLTGAWYDTQGRSLPFVGGGGGGGT